MNEINSTLKRLLDFVEEKGGKSKVARKMGKKPQTFSNWIAKDQKPSVDTLLEFVDYFPEIDLNYIIKGKKTTETTIVQELEEKLKMYEGFMKMATNPKCKGVANSPKLYDIEGTWSSLLNRNNALTCIPILSN